MAEIKVIGIDPGKDGAANVKPLGVLKGACVTPSLLAPPSRPNDDAPRQQKGRGPPAGRGGTQRNAGKERVMKAYDPEIKYPPLSSEGHASLRKWHDKVMEIADQRIAALADQEPYDYQKGKGISQKDVERLLKEKPGQ